MPRSPPRPTRPPAAIAFVGRPNVGKSSLLNALLGEDRAIVSEVPGTTRDAIDTRLAWGRSEVVLIDTAGIRRRGKVASGPAAERYSTLRALSALSRADVAVLVIDAVEGLTAQDAHVAGYAVEEGKGLVVAVNKWDLVEEKTDRTFDQYIEWIRNEVPFLDFAPIVSISAKTGQRVGRVLELAVDIWAERRRRIPTGELNRMLMAATERTPPPPVRGKRPKLFYATQAAIAPPTFVFFASDASAVHFSYRRYLENRLRDTFGFDGTPIRLVFRDRASVEAAASPEGSLAPVTPGAAPIRPAIPPVAVMDGAPRVAVVGAGAWGTTLASIVAQARAGAPAVPPRGSGGRDQRDTSERAAAARASSCRKTLIATAEPARWPARATSSSSRRRRAPASGGRRCVAPHIARERGRAVGRQGPRARHAAAHERGHRRRRWDRAGADRGAVRPEPRRRDRQGPAGLGGRRRRRPRAGEPDRRPARSARVPAVRQQRHPRRRAVRRAQEHHGDRGRRRRRPRVRRQRQGRADDPRPGRDDAAGRGGRAPIR